MRFDIVIIVGFLLLGCTGQQKDATQKKRASSPDTMETSVSSDSMDVQPYDRHTSSVGQLIYVPVYSHIYQQNRQKTFNLTTTLSIRNADPFRMLTITKANYYDSDGNLIQNFLKKEKELDPLSSTSFVVEEQDLRGGVGANFLVSWSSEEPVNLPIVEAVMISTSQQQGISFLSTGRVLQEYQPNEADNN